MAKVWRPISGDFLCPGKILLKADELGITIARGKKALATSEWPGENVRLCELVEEPETPHPDWSQAPGWAQWWVVFPSGIARWHESEPSAPVGEWLVVSDIIDVFMGRTGKSSLAALHIDIPIGIDWRELKERRPK